jgi:hypothetical protein
MHTQQEWWSTSSIRALICLSVASLFLCLGYAAFANNWGSGYALLFLEVVFFSAMFFFAEIILSPLYLIATKLEKRPQSSPLKTIRNSSGSKLLGILDYINKHSEEAIDFSQLTAKNIRSSEELILKELTLIGKKQLEKLLLIQKTLKENHLWKIITLSIVYGIFLYALSELILFIVGILISNPSLAFWRTLTGNNLPIFSIGMIVVLFFLFLIYLVYQLHRDCQFKQALLELTNLAIEEIELENDYSTMENLSPTQ